MDIAMKKTYLKPTMMVVTLQQHSIICASNVSSVNSNVGIGYRGAGSGPARARSFDIDWDDDEPQ